jgi:HlyD family secretion protein
VSKGWNRKIVAAVVLATLLLLAVGVFRARQGPMLAGYPVAARPLAQTVVATGRVAAVSRAQVGSEITGVVVERRVQEGDEVASGDVLAVLRADDFAARVHEAEAALAELETSRRPQAEAALREAEAKLAQAERETARRRSLHERQLLAREDVEQAEQAETIARTAAERARLAAAALAPGRSEETVLRARLLSARAALAKTQIRAETAGTVLTRSAEPGDVVQPGEVLFEIARRGDTELLVPVDEKNLAVLALGQRARCVTDAYPDREFEAIVSLIAPRVDPERGTVDVRLDVGPAPAYLREDMTVSVNIVTGRRARALAVPNDALFDREGGAASLYAVRHGRVRELRVTLGLEGLAMTEVTTGLAEGDWVLIDPTAGVGAGDRVRVAAEPGGRGAEPASAGAARATRNELPAALE